MRAWFGLLPLHSSFEAKATAAVQSAGDLADTLERIGRNGDPLAALIANVKASSLHQRTHRRRNGNGGGAL